MTTMRRMTEIQRGLRTALLHGALLAGSFVFSIPFIWLFSTSCKMPDEMYPPKWIPQMPGGVVRSPYIALRDNERSERPINVSLEDWQRTRGPILDAITERVLSWQQELPQFYAPYLAEPDLAEGIFSRITKRAPDDLFSKVEPVAAAWFAQNVDQDIVREVFEAVYRRMAVSDVVFHGWDVVSVEYPTAGQNYPWRVVSGDAVLVPRTEGLLRPALEVHYQFDNEPRFVLQTVLPLQMHAHNLKKIIVSLHGDRSWHEIWATVETAGRTYRSAQAAYLQSDRAQDITWQFASEDDRSLKMKTWLRLDEIGPSDLTDEQAVRITLECRYGSHLRAGINKLSFNYRDVLRRVPLPRYIQNSVVLVILCVAGQVLGSSLVAFSFARLRWPGREFCFILVLSTLMIPPQVTMIPVFLIYKNIGWYNTLRPLWVPAFFGSAFFIFLLRQFMRTIPTDLEDSAKIDGCGFLGIYARIILPLVKPALATIGIFTFMGTWNDFMGPLIYLSDQELYPLSLGLFALKVIQGGNFGLMMAASVLMTLPIIVLFFVAQRQFIQGITLTGLKG